MKYFFAILMLLVSSAKAANIYVLDAGIDPLYYPLIENRLVAESCYSFPSDERRRVATDFNNQQFSHIYQYQFASLCRNKKGVDHNKRASLVRVDDLPGAEGRNGNPDVSVPIVTNSHQSIVADIIASNTSSSVQQWLAHSQSLIGENVFGEIAYTNYDALDQIGSIVFDIHALGELGTGSLGLKGVKVANLSFAYDGGENGYQDRYVTPCDNHSDMQSPGLFRDMKLEISRLKSQGVTVVVATDNTRHDSDLDNYEMPFPACLSSTVAVGGIDSLGRAQGAIGPDTDFIEDFRHINPIPSGAPAGTVTGTSFATPKVASYLAELVTINPAKTANEALNTLRNTGDLRCGDRVYNGGQLRISYCVVQPNFARARNAIIDSFWKDLVQLIQGNEDEGFYGWNYGTSRHSNGILSYFETIELQQNQNLSASITELVPGANAGESVLRYSFRAFDIDTADEVQVLVNDKPYGYLKTTGSNRLGGTQTVCIASSDLRSGNTNNEVKLKLKTSGETWGVRNLKIEAGIRDSSCNSLDDSSDDEETVSLVLGSVDNNQYGQNYGRDGNTSQLDVQFTPEAGKDHELSWRPYDIESGEMEVFLNNSRVKAIPSTSNNQLGSVDSLSVPVSNLTSGTNTLSFRVSGGDGTWGVTRLLAKSIDDAETGEPGSSVLLDEPEERSFSHSTRSYNYTFNFTPHGFYYDENIRVSFDAYLRHGTLNGFVVRLNGQTIRSIGTYEGRATWRTFSVSIDKNQANIGSNTLQIQTTSSSSVANSETSISNVKVVTNFTPQLNVAVEGLTTPPKLKLNTPFDATVIIANVSPKTSPSNTISFYISTNSNQSNPILVASSAIPAIVGETSITETVVIDSPEIKNGRYLWACINRVSTDVNAIDDCSSAIQLDVSGFPVSSVIMLLLGDD